MGILLKTTLAAITAVCLAACLLFACASPWKDAIAITHVTVIDMAGAAPLLDQTVLIARRRVLVVRHSTSVKIPGGAGVVDGAGKFLIPGLADMHVHLTAAG